MPEGLSEWYKVLVSQEDYIVSYSYQLSHFHVRGKPWHMHGSSVFFPPLLKSSFSAAAVGVLTHITHPFEFLRHPYHLQTSDCTWVSLHWTFNAACYIPVKNYRLVIGRLRSRRSFNAVDGRILAVDQSLLLPPPDDDHAGGIGRCQ